MRKDQPTRVRPVAENGAAGDELQAGAPDRRPVTKLGKVRSLRLEAAGLGEEGDSARQEDYPKGACDSQPQARSANPDRDDDRRQSHPDPGASAEGQI